MQTTKKDFERFKTEFLRWVDKFGLKEYEIWFYHENPKPISDGAIDSNEDGKYANVYYAKNIAKENMEQHSPEAIAKHEAIHLLLSRFDWLAKMRCIMSGDIREENEKLVRILEKVLK